MAEIYKTVGTPKIGKTKFDMSYEIKNTLDMGMLIPVMCKTCIPGDIWEIGQELVIRFMPMVTPLLHEINAFTWTFFVPFRLLDENWEDFATGGQDGMQEPDLPLWSGQTPQNAAAGNVSPIGTLWDYLGFGINIGSTGQPTNQNPTLLPIDYPLRAYNFIYNNYFRGQDFEPEIEYPYDYTAVMNANHDQDKPGHGAYDWMEYGNTNLFYGNWEKDYFTVALPWQQRGPTPALSLYGEADVTWTTVPGMNTAAVGTYDGSNTWRQAYANGLAYGGTPAGYLNTITDGNGQPIFQIVDQRGPLQVALNQLGQAITQPGVGLKVDMSSASAGDVADIRQAFQVQKYLERNARIGGRYFEQLHGRYNTPILDVRLDRPEYVGGSRSPIIISEVLQTSATQGTSAQGNMAGHGITADKTYIGKYRAHEWGYLMTLLCVKPRSAYSQGIDKEFTIRTRYDLPAPEFVNLSEEGILNQEVYFSGSVGGVDENIWGFQQKYATFRESKSKIAGLMRTAPFDSWHLGREFANLPNLSYQMIKIDPDQTKRAFAVPEENSLLMNFANVLTAIRPLPLISEPGLIDHH